MLGSLFFKGLIFLVAMHLIQFKLLSFGIFSVSFIADTLRPANLTAIQAFSTKEKSTRSLGVVRLAINLGYAFSPLLRGLIIESLGYDFVFTDECNFGGSSWHSFLYFFRNKKEKKIEKTKHSA